MRLLCECQAGGEFFDRNRICFMVCMLILCLLNMREPPGTLPHPLHSASFDYICPDWLLIYSWARCRITQRCRLADRQERRRRNNVDRAIKRAGFYMVFIERKNYQLVLRKICYKIVKIFGVRYFLVNEKKTVVYPMFKCCSMLQYRHKKWQLTCSIPSGTPCTCIITRNCTTLDIYT